MDFYKIPKKYIHFVTKYLNNQFFSRERLIKGELDLVVSQDALKAEDLMVKTQSIIPLMKEILLDHKKPLEEEKEDIII